MIFIRADVESAFNAGQMQMKYFELEVYKSKTVLQTVLFSPLMLCKQKQTTNW